MKCKIRVDLIPAGRQDDVIVLYFISTILCIFLFILLYSHFIECCGLLMTRCQWPTYVCQHRPKICFVAGYRYCCGFFLLFVVLFTNLMCSFQGVKALKFY